LSNGGVSSLMRCHVKHTCTNLQTSLAAVLLIDAPCVHGRVTRRLALMPIASAQPAVDTLHQEMGIGADRTTTIRTTAPTSCIKTLFPLIEMATARNLGIHDCRRFIAVLALGSKGTICGTVQSNSRSNSLAVMLEGSRDCGGTAKAGDAGRGGVGSFTPPASLSTLESGGIAGDGGTAKAGVVDEN